MNLVEIVKASPAELKNAFAIRGQGGSGPAPRLPKELESELAAHPIPQPQHTEEGPSAAKDFALLSLQLAPLWTGAARAAAIKPWTLGRGNNSNSIILTRAMAERRNCWRWLGKQEPSSSRGKSWYWLFSLSLPCRPGLRTRFMDLLSAQSQFSFSKAYPRKTAGMLFLSLGDTAEDSQAGNSGTIL